MGSLNRSLRALRKLPALDLAVLVEAWLQFAWVDLSIRVRGYRHWRHWLSSTITHQPATSDEINRLIRLSEIAARHHWSAMNCLRRSLVQRQLLGRRGVASELNIGVRAGQDKRLEAHAWLTRDGLALNDTPANIATYQRLEADHWDALPVFTQR